MDENDKIYMQRILRRLKESLVEIRKVSREDSDVIRAQREIEEAARHISRILNKEL